MILRSIHLQCLVFRYILEYQFFHSYVQDSERASEMGGGKSANHEDTV